MEDEPDIKNIDSVQFSILSPTEIVGRSVVEVTKQDTYDKDIPVIKGLFDPRMGTTDMGKICNTCGQKNIDCPGHFGHINLARPVYNIHFMQYVLKILNCICFKCSKLLVDKGNIYIKEILKKTPKKRFDTIYNECKKINRCGKFTNDGCNCKQPEKYKFEGLSGISVTFKDLEDSKSSKIEKEYINIEYIKSILERISDGDLQYIGFSNMWCRPEWLLCSVLPVPPPSMRPSIKQDNSQRMDDDLTHKLSDIVKSNNSLNQKIKTNANKDIIDDLTKVLQYHVATLIDNEIPNISQSVHRSGRPLKAIRQRLKGKEGRIRNNLMGKRVDYSARSVITPDPNIELDQLGVPISICMNLTFPETVNKYNIEALKDLVKNGPMKYPGAKTIIKTKLKTKITILNDSNIELEYGDIVNRHLLNDDWVLFNRQPSLHKMSMMGHRVKAMTGNTFRLNVSVTPPYNADFDGDEMNMHAPQSNATRIELKEIINVTKHIISPRENKPIITIVQDTLLGIYKLTSSLHIKYLNNNDKLLYLENTNMLHVKKSNSEESSTITEKYIDESVFNKKQMMNLISNLSVFNGIFPDADVIHEVNRKKIKFWSGKNIFSYIIPDYLNLEMDNNNSEGKDDKLNFIKIVNGSVKQGTFDKSIFTKTSKGLIHTIYNDYGEEGPNRTKDFIDDIQKIINYYILNEGFSIGISDMVTNNKIQNKINTIIENQKKQIISILQDLHFNILENYTGSSNKDNFEGKVNNILNKSVNETGELALKHLPANNRAVSMILSGSKGKVTNIGQMIACLGQQNVDGKRIPYGFENRTLPHFKKFDDTAEARGFVSNSFISGQTPQEFFFHAMGGREGLIDTAVKTSETGYVQRKLVKSMEDLKVNYDFTVRTASGKVVQFLYGNDGMDATYIESVPLLINKLDIEDIYKDYTFDKNTKWNNYFTEECQEEINTIENLNEYLYKMSKNIVELKEKLVNLVDGNNIFHYIHFPRLLSNNITKKIDYMCDISFLEINNNNEQLKKDLLIKKNINNNFITDGLIDIYLNPAILIKKYKINKDEYYKALDIFKYTLKRSIIAPGEMVGTLAAQSIGEPATQMTLNTFHFAGVSSKSNVTRGIPRLRELIHLSSNISSPSIRVYLKNKYKFNKKQALFIKNNIEYTKLEDIVESCKIYYDPKHVEFDSGIEGDKMFLQIYKEFEELYEKTEEDNNPWIIRIVFNKELMLDKGILVEDIYNSIIKYNSNIINIIFSDENSKEIVARISLNLDVKEDYDEINEVYNQNEIISIFKEFKSDLLQNVNIKGIKGITNTYVSEEYSKEDEKNQWVIDTDGTNLLDILSNKYIDTNKTSSNDVLEIHALFGIEATRNKLIEEITSVVEYAGEYINSRHIELLCDTMTFSGNLISINRQGINRGDVGPLAKCSFEDTTDQLIKSSIFGEVDGLDGVSSNIMLGQKIKAGTNMCELLLDEEELFNNMEKINEGEGEEILVYNNNNIDVALDDIKDDDYLCDINSFNMSI